MARREEPAICSIVIAVAILLWPAALTGQTHPVDGAPRNGFLVDSPWPSSHAGPAQQAAVALPGPRSAEPRVQLRYFEDDAGEAFGTSPWHVLSGQRYTNSSTARTLWGATLTHAYKYEIDGDTFRFVNSFELNSLPVWIGWNLFGLADGRIIIPHPSGLRLRQYRGEPSYGRQPSLLAST